MAADVIQLLNKHDVDRVTLLGHSLGGRLAMTTALLHPERIDSLIVADMAPVDYTNTNRSSSWSLVQRVVTACAQLDLTGLKNRSDVDRALAKAGVGDKIIRQFAMQNIGYDTSEPAQLRWRCNLASLYHNLDSLGRCDLASWSNRSLNRPTMFISGENSSYVTPGDHPTILRYFPQTEFRVLPSAGHWLHADAPVPFREEINAFLQRHRL
jgi:pimeloyl-ACP methyl ester carboxylesterase